MTCKICNRYSCTESFHSIEEQEVWERLCNMNERELKNEIIDLRNEIIDLRNTLESLLIYARSEEQLRQLHTSGHCSF